MSEKSNKERDTQVELRSYIATQLERKRLSQKELADKLDRDPSTVSNWIHGRQPIPLDMIQVIATALEERNPLKMYKMAGIFVNHPAESLIEELADATDDEISLVKKLMRALLDKNDD